MSAAVFPAEILARASAAVNVCPSDLIAHNRDPKLSRARWAAMFVMRERGMGFTAIGRRLRRDHSTVIYGIRGAIRLRNADPAFADLCRTLE